MSFAHDILGEKERKQREARLRDGLNQAKKETTTAGSGSGERWDWVEVRVNRGGLGEN